MCGFSSRYMMIYELSSHSGADIVEVAPAYDHGKLIYLVLMTDV